MDPMTIGMVLQAVGPIVAAIGGAVAEGDYATARSLRERALREYGPDMLPVFDRVVAQEVGESAFAALTEDDGLKNTQADVMDEYRNIYDSEGRTSADLAASQIAQNEVATRAGSDLADAQVRMARTGQSGNPALEAALAASISGDAVGSTAEMANRQAIAARQRALEALTARGGMAGQMRGQDLAFGSTKAGGQDRISLFNASARQGAISENNANAAATFSAKKSIADARAGAYRDLASTEEEKARRKQAAAAGLGQATSSAGAGIAKLPK